MEKAPPTKRPRYDAAFWAEALRLASGAWAYLGAFQDACTKHVVGWQVRADIPEALVTSALQRALLAQRAAPGLIVHSDRGRTR